MASYDETLFLFNIALFKVFADPRIELSMQNNPHYHISKVSLFLVTLGQKGMLKLHIFSANFLGFLLMPSFSGRQHQFRCKYAI
jgi:hypothetical protein